MNSNLKNVRPYVPSSRKDTENYSLLDWNESSSLWDEVYDHIKSNLKNLNYYPDPSYSKLKKVLSNYTNVDQDFIETFNGSDSALEVVFRVLLNSGDEVIVPVPNYAQIYPVIQSLGGKLNFIDKSNMENSIERLRPKIVYISNPNNPVGDIFNILPLIYRFPDVYFIVDEAYIEFSINDSVFANAQDVKNLIVTRTFSKALSLAGLRLGYLTASGELMSKIRLIKNDKQVNIVAMVAAEYILNNVSLVWKHVNKIIETRNWFLNNVRTGYFFPSSANFVLYQNENSSSIIEELRQNWILVRDRGSDIPNSIRITIGELPVMENVALVLNKYN